ncbi:hypothetical protein [Halovivax sp.]|uniref:hypothetical protein n=1 Tax=Halovivax sp. TaxID=1935978 RepID=UPI0025C4BA0C|nr:hypothetical protein [Halovivax sp.]
MSDALLVLIVGIPVFVQVLLAAFTYYDATDVGIESPRRWTAIVGLIPIYGIIVYILRRSELSYDPESDPYREREYDIHPSRRDDDDP